MNTPIASRHSGQYIDRLPPTYVFPHASQRLPVIVCLLLKNCGATGFRTSSSRGLYHGQCASSVRIRFRSRSVSFLPFSRYASASSAVRVRPVMPQ